MKKGRIKGQQAEHIGGPRTMDGMVLVGDLSSDDPRIHDLECPCCEGVPLVYKKGAKVNGGLERSDPVLSTKSGYKDKHLQGCTYVSPEVTVSLKDRSLKAAVANNEYILLNLNFLHATDEYSRKQVSPDVKRRHGVVEPPEVSAWKARHDYKAHAIRSVDDYIKTIRRIRKLAQEYNKPNYATSKVAVHHNGRVQSYESFSGGADRVRLRHAFQQTIDAPVDVKGRYQKGRPVLLTSEMGKWSFTARDNGNVLASSYSNENHHNKIYIVFEKAVGSEFEKTLMQQAEQGASFGFIAEPIVVSKLSHAFNNQKGLVFKIKSPDQVTFDETLVTKGPSGKLFEDEPYVVGMT